MRGRKEKRQEDKKETGGQLQLMLVELKTKKAAAAKHVYKLVYMSKTAQREKTHKRDQRLWTHAERGTTLCSMVVNLWV